MLSTEGQIAHLKTRGVALELCDEQEALEYLRANTYYYKLAAYRVLFPKRSAGPMTASTQSGSPEYLVPRKLLCD